MRKIALVGALALMAFGQDLDKSKLIDGFSGDFYNGRFWNRLDNGTRTGWVLGISEGGSMGWVISLGRLDMSLPNKQEGPPPNPAKPVFGSIKDQTWAEFEIALSAYERDHDTWVKWQGAMDVNKRYQEARIGPEFNICGARGPAIVVFLEVASQVTELYKDPANIPIPVTQIYMVSMARLAGATEKEITVWLETLRKEHAEIRSLPKEK